jgi:Tfp pilus assembly protein PilN
MIKINLTAAKKETDFSNLGGIDFTRVKIVPVMIAIVLLYAPDFTLAPMWEEEFNAKTNEFTSLQSKLNGLKRKVSQSATLERQIRELQAQENNLAKKLTAVKQAISEKRNPSNLLVYIAKNIPQDLWILELNIDNEVMTVKGQALNYVSVGNFVNNLRSSIFIKDANIKNTTSTVRESDKRRIESFEISFAIARLD